MTEKNITIVVTVYNKAAYIEDCLISILHQTNEKFEMIVVDDGSEDNSLQICKNIQSVYKNFTVFSQEHAGAWAARNLGIEKCSTDYLLFVDGDDILTPETVEKLNNIALFDKDLTVFGINYVLPGGKKVCSVDHKLECFNDREQIQKNLLRLWESGLMYSVCNKLLSMDIIRKNNIRFRNKDFGEDLTFVCEYTRYCNNILMLDECFYDYMQHNCNSLSKMYRNNMFEIRTTEHHELMNYFQNMDCIQQDTSEFLAKRFVERIVGCIENEISGDCNKKMRYKFSQVRKIISCQEVQQQIRTAKLSSRKMKVLVWFMRYRLSLSTFICGLSISAVKKFMPGFFVVLKMHR
ncbi:MAG: glycosyltransferase [Oscillospiraceae bacterium]|nr:glycosyltransferase [Oscillospiraceae bacterium]